MKRPTSTPSFKRKGEQTETCKAIHDYWKKKFAPEGKQRRGFVFAKKPLGKS